MWHEVHIEKQYCFLSFPRECGRRLRRKKKRRKKDPDLKERSYIVETLLDKSFSVKPSECINPDPDWGQSKKRRYGEQNLLRKDWFATLGST